jgi:hypothetical protein
LMLSTAGILVEVTESHPQMSSKTTNIEKQQNRASTQYCSGRATILHPYTYTDPSPETC